MAAGSRRFACLVLLACSWHGVAGAQTAGEHLRWQLAAGDTFRLRMTQNVQTATKVGDKTTAANVTTALEIAWTVESVDADGNARIRQSFQRLFVKGQGPDGKAMTYDSAEPKQADAEATAKSRQLGPLLDSQFLVTMSPRGEMLGVAMTPETESRLSDPASAELAGRVMTTTFVENLLRPSLGILPEGPVQSGDGWSVDRQVESPLGRLSVTDHYRYEGKQSPVGRQSARIRMVIQSKAEGAAASTEPGRGLFLFDAEAGCLVSSELTGDLTYETPYRDTKIQVQTTSATRLRIDRLNSDDDQIRD